MERRLLSRKTLVFLILAASAVRLWIVVNLPLYAFPEASHDEGLYVQLARTLVAGDWLGPFNQLTLMKGPGYPFFLAITNLSGLPVSVTHAMFQGIAILVVTWAAFRLTGSKIASGAIFFLLAFNPAGFLPSVNRVLRDQIYWLQVILVFALIVLVFLDGNSRKARLSVALGLLFGWLWLTREEGAFFVPALVVLALAIAADWVLKRRPVGPLAKNALVAVLAFAAFVGAFRTTNYFVYGAFVGVDTKQSDFKAALKALQSVEAGEVKPYVPVTFAAQHAIMKVSPAAAEVLDEMQPGGPAFWWSAFGCRIYESTCNEIAGGWFIWALRDAAALRGFYDSPSAASEGFGRIAAEVVQACESGRLTCRRSLLSHLPRMTAAQWLALPGAMLNSLKVATLIGIEAHGGDTKSAAPPDEFRRYFTFLNDPLVGESRAEQTVATGWFYDSGSTEWPSFRVVSPEGSDLQASLTRKSSPDLQAHFGDLAAASNRFDLAYRCPSKCSIVADRQEGPDLVLHVEGSGAASVTSSTASLFLDAVAHGSFGQSISTAHQAAAAARDWLLTLFKLLLPPLCGVGLLALCAASARAILRRSVEPVLLAAWLAWALIASRIGLLALIDVSSFPAATSLLYLQSVIYLICIASILSIAAWLGRGRPVRS